MENIEKFEEGDVVHLSPEAQAHEDMETSELKKTLEDRYAELQQKIIKGDLTDDEIEKYHEEMNGLEEQIAGIESITKAA